MRNSLFKGVAPLWNVLPYKMKRMKSGGNQIYGALKKRLTKYSSEKFVSLVDKLIDRPQYS